MTTPHSITSGGGFDRPLRVRQEGGDTSQGFVGPGIEERVVGLLPMIPFLQAPLGIDEDVGDVLDIAHLPFAAPHFQQRVVGGGFRVGRIEQQDATAARRGQSPKSRLIKESDRACSATDFFPEIDGNGWTFDFPHAI
jgi:hypothetical protein